MTTTTADDGDGVLRLLSPTETAELRRRFLEGPARQAIRDEFTENPQFNSATLLFAQYWSDNALDEVQHEVVYSALVTPDLVAAAEGPIKSDLPFQRPESDRVNFPQGHRVSASIDAQPLYYGYIEGLPITLFAAFCPEGAHQDDAYLENHLPVAIYRRSESGDVDVEIVGEMVRPWLDGVAFSWIDDPHACDFESFAEEIRTWNDDRR